MRHTIPLISLLAVLLPPSAAARAGAGDAAIVQLTKGARTDAERASRLLDGAKLLADQPAVMVALLEKAVEFGMKAAASPAGADAALGALGLLRRKAPDRKDLWGEKHLEVLRLRYRYAPRAAKAAAGNVYLAELLRRADAAEQACRWPETAAALGQAYPIAGAIQSPLKKLIAFRRARARHYETVVGQVEQARKVLAAAAGAPARLKLVQLLVAELQDPAEAEKLLTADLDEAWRTYVPLLAKGPETAAPTAAAELGRWLMKVVTPMTSKYSRIAALQTALRCYERAAQAPGAAQTSLLSRRLAVGKIEKELEKIALASEAAGWWGHVEMLPSLDLDGADKRGMWRIENGSLTVWPLERSHLRLPATVTGDYRVSVRFAHRNLRAPVRGMLDRFGLGRAGTANPGMSLAVPIADRHVCITVAPGRRETLVSLFLIAPERADDSAEKPAGVLGPRAAPGGRGDRNAGAGGGIGDWRAGLVDTAEKPPAEKTVTAKGPGIALTRPHQVDVAVFVTGDRARITVQLDGKALLRWRGEASRCSLTGSWPGNPPANTVLIGGTRGPSAFSSVKLCPLTGRVDIESAPSGPGPDR
jgi:hypothetical protein